MDIFRIRYFIESLIKITILFFLLCWPSLINGSPIFFYDSLSYLGSAATAFYKVVGLETPWAEASGDAAARPEAPQNEASQAPESEAGVGNGIVVPAETQAAGVQSQSQSGPTIIAGRSIYYGAFLFVADVLGSLWLGVILQALIVILSIYLTFLVVSPAPSRATLLTMIMLGVFSSLPFYVSYLMPDFLTGVVILAVANLLAFGARMRRWILVVWGLLLLFGLISHTSHILIAGIMMLGWGLLQVVRRRPVFTLSSVGCITVLAIAVVAEVAFFKAVEAVYGAAPVRPPFLMARTISDGPGYAYLVDNCDRHDLRICDFMNVLPQETDQILWSRDPERGVYGISDAETRRDLNDQQMEFVFSVLRYDPMGQAGASIGGFIQQLLMIRLDEFAYNPSLRMNLKINLPSYQETILEDTILYRDEFPLLYFNTITILTVILFIIYLFYNIFIILINNLQKNVNLWQFFHKYKKKYQKIFDDHDKAIIIFITLVVSAVLINAAVTGILSAPHDRYQARVIWLIPFLGMYLMCLSNKYVMPPVRLASPA